MAAAHHLGPHKAIVKDGVFIGCEYCGPEPMWGLPCPSNVLQQPAPAPGKTYYQYPVLYQCYFYYLSPFAH